MMKGGNIEAQTATADSFPLEPLRLADEEYHVTTLNILTLFR